MFSYTDYSNSHAEPNWRYAERCLGVVDGPYGAMAVMDRYARKAREAQEDYFYELSSSGFFDDCENAASEGYYLHLYPEDPPYTEEDYERDSDPEYGYDPVYLGPYIQDQNDNGYFTFIGPELPVQGPRIPFPSRSLSDEGFDREFQRYLSVNRPLNDVRANSHIAHLLPR